MADYVKAIKYVFLNNCFSYYTINEQSWVAGAIRIGFINKQNNYTAIVDNLSKKGFEYVGKRGNKLIFKRKINSPEDKPKLNSLQELCDSL